MRAINTKSGPPAWQGCSVCRAAHNLVAVRDALVNTGMDTADDQDARNSQIVRRMHTAAAVWDSVKDNRHTGAHHAPVVTP